MDCLAFENELSEIVYGVEYFYIKRKVGARRCTGHSPGVGCRATSFRYAHGGRFACAPLGSPGALNAGGGRILSSEYLRKMLLPLCECRKIKKSWRATDLSISASLQGPIGRFRANLHLSTRYARRQHSTFAGPSSHHGISSPASCACSPDGAQTGPRLTYLTNRMRQDVYYGSAFVDLINSRRRDHIVTIERSGRISAHKSQIDRA